MKKLLLTLLAGTLPFGFIASAESEGNAPSPETQRPTLSNSVLPDYPLEARAKGLEGTVMLELLVDASGEILAVGSTSDVDACLKAAALAAAQEWTFDPRVGTDQPMIVRVPIKFTLQTHADHLDRMAIAAR
ncbi:MAG: TonB family protein [Verrucomicrobiota bacterium]